MKSDTIAYLVLGLLAFLLLSGGAAGFLGAAAGAGGGGGGGENPTLPGEVRARTASGYSPGAAVGMQRTTAITSPLDPRLTYENLRAAEIAAGQTFFTRSQQGFGGPGITPGVRVPWSAAFGFGGDTYNADGTPNRYMRQQRQAGLKTEAVWSAPEFTRPPVRASAPPPSRPPPGIQVTRGVQQYPSPIGPEPRPKNWGGQQYDAPIGPEPAPARSPGFLASVGNAFATARSDYAQIAAERNVMAGPAVPAWAFPIPSAGGVATVAGKAAAAVGTIKALPTAVAAPARSRSTDARPQGSRPVVRAAAPPMSAASSQQAIDRGREALSRGVKVGF